MSQSSLPDPPRDRLPAPLRKPDDTSVHDTRSLRLSQRALSLREDPFCFFAVDEYLPRDWYEELYASYPEGVDYAANDEGKLGFRSSEVESAFERFCNAHPAWRELVDFFASDAFVHDMEKRLRPALVRARPWVGRKRWRHDTHRPVSDDPLRYLLFEPMRTTFQFSVLPRGAAVAPHTDAPRKLVSLLLYFADPDWQPEWGGATDFYVPRDPRAARRWSPTARVGFEALEPIGSTGFVANRLAGFVRSPDSWHGVRPIACPEGRGRKALLINYKRLKWSKRHRP